jgi:hypothetical protein
MEMKGHEGIIKMRKKGYAPTMISLDDLSFPSPLANWKEHDHTPTVCVHKEAIEGLDLRFLVNMRVSVTSCSEDRAKRLFNACKAAGATWIAASHTEIHGEVAKTGWMDFYHG